MIVTFYFINFAFEFIADAHKVDIATSTDQTAKARNPKSVTSRNNQNILDL